MTLTEKEITMLEDMKEIEIIQEEIETYLIEKYGLENLEEGNFFQWIASPLTRLKKHYITRDGKVKYAYKDQGLMDRDAAGDTTLTKAEKKRIRDLKKLQTDASKAVQSRKDAKVEIRNAEREKKFKKRDLDTERKAFNREKKLDLDRSEESKMYALMYGDGMSRKAAKKQAKIERKKQEQRQRDLFAGRIAARDQTAEDKDLLKTRGRTISAIDKFRDAARTRDLAKSSHKTIKGNIEDLRNE